MFKKHCNLATYILAVCGQLKADLLKTASDILLVLLFTEWWYGWSRLSELWKRLRDGKRTIPPPLRMFNQELSEGKVLFPPLPPQIAGLWHWVLELFWNYCVASISMGFWAFFAVWPRGNWEESEKSGEGGGDRPISARSNSKKKKKAEDPTEMLAINVRRL